MCGVPEIKDTKFNHGYSEQLVMTCSVDHEIQFQPGDIINILKSCASDSMAKVINEVGRNFNLDQMAQCYSVDDLNDEGVKFINDMYFFIHGND